MSHTLDQDAASAASPRTDLTSNGVSSPEPVQPVAVDRAVDWGRQRPRITLGAAALLAIAASAATAISLRRRQERQLGRLAWITARAGALGARTAEVPPAARAGGVGGTLLLAALIGARARQARAHSEVHELRERIAALESLANSRRPRPKDLAIGAGIGMLLAAACARGMQRRTEAPTTT